MAKNKDIRYSIGLDIGTNSVGWAVMDEHYELLKKGNHHMWGSRLFDAAEPAATRRASRSIRRRYNKRRERIRLLRDLLGDMVMEVDPTFFIRLLNVSFLDEEDKQKNLGNDYKDNYNLFIEKDFNDKTYYDKYPTIYHLRKELCENKEKADPRLIYLALHHIVKYRGNFLKEGQSFAKVYEDIEEKLDNTLKKFMSLNDLDNLFVDNDINSMITVLSKIYQRSKKADDLLKIMNPTKEERAAYKEFTKALVGLKFNVSKMILAQEVKKDDKDIELDFSNVDYDSTVDGLQAELGEYIEFIEMLHSINSWVELQDILGNNSTISAAMVERYEEHKNDLRVLKKVIREELPDKYNEVFREDNPKLHNYLGYIKYPKNTPVEEFYEYIKRLLAKVDTGEAREILERIDLEKFMLKQNSRTNGSIPYQMQKDEMIQIIDNQSVYYPQLKENREKLISILEFRIPYYFGPLNTHSEFAWIKKFEDKQKERILPWNYDQIVDIDATAEGFIERMQNTGTYFPDKPVMAKNSLTVSKFEVLNELNKIRINGKLIPVETKKELLSDLFMKNKTITDKKLKDWLVTHQYYDTNEELKIEGYQKDLQFSTSLAPWIDFTKIFGEINASNYQLIEKIIYDISIFEDKKILKRRLKKVYQLDDLLVDKILKLNYTGWSRLSEKLLTGIKSKNSKETILSILENSNMNLMEIINDESLGFKQIIEESNKKDIEGPFRYDEVKKLAGSPAIKRGIWQALLVVQEITKFMKHEPSHIYIEFAREEQEKVRTESRIAKLQKIYKDLNLQTKEDQLVYESLKKEDAKKKIDTDALYLYYLQMGKSMYSGKPLDIDKLSTYHIDHILPRSLIKDDSLDNRVLVLPKENEWKLDSETVPFEIRNKMMGFWQKLHENGLMSNKKFFSLIRTDFNEKDKKRFINRQLVETRQIIKNVAVIINDHYTNTNVVTVRAELSHQFRERYKIYKNRDLNDLHHAHDAYIACILGQFIHQNFGNMDVNMIYGQYKKNYKKDVQEHNNYGFILNSMNHIHFNDDNSVIWDPSYIGKIKSCFCYKDVYVTKKLEQNDAKLFDLTILPSDKNSENGVTKAKIPVNKYRKDVNKYGGFSGDAPIMLAIEADKGKKHVRQVIAFPLRLKNYNDEERIKFIEKEKNLKNVKILTEVKKNQLILINHQYFFITGTNELVNATQLKLSAKNTKNLFNLVDANKHNKLESIDDANFNEVIQELICKLQEPIYSRYNSIGKEFEDSYEKINAVTKQDKLYIIEYLIAIMSAKATQGYIKPELAREIGTNGKNKGRIKSFTIDLNKTTFISTSVTGLFSKKYKL
ncbi:type II CRISPR RNA-guided endonuclease Cas9 [Sharpea azabuensis]|uniref:type II CRISPR RNA-guided endonuclease Cas9 n=1 Tax=Sharpea azabuensis TaxID=322505 RepID=UPI0013DD54E0|nr:type II CRISPR RNA-guided endonuclease Cas9 [Sharpea azabuensis]